MSNRNHQPCRVCGITHTNPNSSSICPPCGALERVVRLKQEQQASIDANTDCAICDDYTRLKVDNDELRKILKEASDYLDFNKHNNIMSGSFYHSEFKRLSKGVQDAED